MSTFVERIQRTQNPSAIIALLELECADFGAPVMLADSTQDWISNGQTYLACPFGFKTPEDTGDGSPQMNLNIANADRAIGEQLELLQSTSIVQATLKITDSYDPNTIQFSFSFPISKVNLNMQQASATAGVDSIMRQQSVRRIMNKQNLPGIN